MATARQRRAAEKLVENGGKSVSGAMREAGYSPATAENPDKLTKSKGFAQLCDELGLTDDLLLSALVDDIKSKKGNRKQELELGFKVKGLLKEGGAKVTDPKGRALYYINMEPDEDGDSTTEADS